MVLIIEFFNDSDINNWYLNTKLNFNYTVSISLTAILFLEILKLFYIKSTKQILIVSGIVILKIIINYFVEFDIAKDNTI